MKITYYNRPDRLSLLRKAAGLALLCLLLAGCGGKEDAGAPVSGETEEAAMKAMEDGYPVWGNPDTYEVMAYRTGESENFTYDNGVSLIAGKTGVIRNEKGEEISPYAGNIKELTKNTAALQHIDIAGGPGTAITYDLGEEFELNSALLCHFYHASVDYSVGRYQLFLGNDPETLYTEETCIADYDNTGKWKANVERTGADHLFTFHKPAKGRYFGIRFLKANPTDDLIRIAKICLYNDGYSGLRNVYPKFGVNLFDPADAFLTGMSGESTVPASGSFEMLCDGVTGEQSALVIQNTEEYTDLTFPVSDQLYYDRMAFTVTAPEGGLLEIYFLSGDQKAEGAEPAVKQKRPVSPAADAESGGQDEGQEAVLSGETQTVSFPERRNGDRVTVRMRGKGEWFLEEIGIYSDDRRLMIRTDKTVNEDFLGYGVNVLPMALMKESLSNGYKEALFELEKRRITAIRPGAARVWFQIDWMETEPGIYDFDSERMRAVYPYLDALKEAGTLVELNFGWKVGSQAAKWFSADGTNGAGGAPAPKDIESYARSCAALLKELYERGYDNIRAVSAYNEPNFKAEFEYAGEDKKRYYLDMMTAIRKQLEIEGLLDRVAVWGPEESGAYDWFAYMAENGSRTFDAYSFHLYGATCDGLREQSEKRLKAAEGKPVILTEFGFLENDTSWEAGNAAYAVTAADAGLSGALFWVMTGVTLADPGTFTLNDKDRHLWGPLQNGADFVYRNYYEYGLLMRYVEPHSKVYEVENRNGDIRAACFEAPDGSMTLAVQVKNTGSDRNLAIEFDRDIGRKFHKYVYSNDTETGAAALLPACRGCVEAGDLLRDSIGSGYSLIVYTTGEPGKQIVMDQVKVEIEGGESVDLKASVLGSCGYPADGSEEIVWSVASGGGTVDARGHYQSEEGQRRYTTIAVKAELKDDPSVWAVTLVVLT